MSFPMYAGLLVGLLSGILGILFTLANFGWTNIAFALVFGGFIISVPFVLAYMIDRSGLDARPPISSREEFPNDRGPGS